MPDLPTRLDLYAIGRDYVLQRARKIDPVVIDTEGSDANVFVGVGSVMGDHVVRHLGYRMAARTLNGSDDEDLDRYVFENSDGEVVRKGAAAAIGTVTLGRPTFVAGSGSVGAGTRVATPDGIEYVLTTAASFGATDLVSSAEARAVQAGKASQVVARAISKYSQPDQLFDKTLTVTNDAAMAGGEDAERDEVLRDRFKAWRKSLSRGIKSAIEVGARAVTGVTSAQAIEVTDADGNAARLVLLYIADSSGVASDSLARKVSTSLEEYRSCGIQVHVSTSTPQIVDIALRLRFAANVDTVTLTDTVRRAIVAYVNSLAVNSTLLVGDLFAVLRRYKQDGLVVEDDAILAPVGDLLPSIGQTIRTTLENVTASAA